jgi:Rho-binding antiterminator
MTTPLSSYHPISCEFHDLLEVLATTRKFSQIRFLDAEGAVAQRSAAITDVFARGGAEYLSLSTGETLRLDQLLAVGDARLADYCNSDA